jgi:vacuolar-type H+-ATPase subunit E/Vma4
VALNELLRTLEDEARARIDALLDRARAEAAGIREAAASELAARRTAELRTREAELRSGAARVMEAARRDAARRVLEARAEALARVRRRAEERLAARRADPELLPGLRREVLEGLGYLGDGPSVVEADPAVLDGLRAAVDGRRDVSFAPAPRGGLVLRSADGTLTVDATFASRLARAWPRLAIELVRRLESAS